MGNWLVVHIIMVAINPDITWEVSELANIGIDFGMWDQRIKLSVDYLIIFVVIYYILLLFPLNSDFLLRFQIC